MILLTDEQKLQYMQKMYKIAGLGMKLYNELGYGYAEPIYQECLSVLCDEAGVPWEREKALKMHFHNKILKKEYIADFVCYGDIIVELKAVAEVNNDHRAQLFNYLRITNLPVGMLMNFGNEKHLHTEKYMFQPKTNRYELVYENVEKKLRYYPGTNVLRDDLT